MVNKICIDSNILIDILKGNELARSLIEKETGELCTTPINIFEVWYGKKKEETIDDFLDTFNMLNFSKESAKKAAEIAKNLELNGKALDARDIFIGAICITNNTSLLTYNKKHFERLEDFGLSLI